MTCSQVYSAQFSFSPGRDILVHYGRGISIPDSLRAETLQYRSMPGFWDDVIDFVSETTTIENSTSSHFPGALVRDKFGGNVSHIVTNVLDGATERAIFDAYPDAKIVFYDNGLASHNNKRITVNRNIHGSNNCIRECDIARVERAYFTFKGRLPIPSHMSAIPTSGFLPDATARALGEVKKHHAAKNPELFAHLKRIKSCHLVLGTAFYRAAGISYESERDIYRDYIGSLLENPKAIVVFKEHPRSSREPFLDAHDRLIIIRSSFPVEVLPLITEVETAASISSTALLHLQMIFGIPPKALPASPDLLERFPHIKLLHTALGGDVQEPLFELMCKSLAPDTRASNSNHLTEPDIIRATTQSGRAR